MAMSRQSFKLRGRRFELSRGEVEERLKGIEPKSVAKYHVRIGSKVYPPKQALSVAIKQSLVEFTTMDAARILKKLGFEVVGLEEASTPQKTVSEQLFEGYLASTGLTDFRFEVPQEGTTRKPDYSLSFAGQQILFEVKQFDPTGEDWNRQSGYFDPYRPIREKIEAARKKFKDLDKLCCNLVLFNNGKPLVDLLWWIVYSAMLGNLAFQFPVDTNTGIGDLAQSRNVFHGDGKMLHYRGGEPLHPQNTTISAILVLRNYLVGQKRFEIAIKRKEAILGRTLVLDEFMREMELASGSEMDFSLTRPRVIVHENPFARVQLPRELFRGPFDERYALVEDRVVRIFCGEQLQELEREEKNASSPPGFHPVSIRGEDLSTTISRDRR